jgi:hypothetical protein
LRTPRLWPAALLAVAFASVQPAIVRAAPVATVVHVVDDAGAAVAGAVIWTAPPAPERALGVTDRAGTLVLALDPVVPIVARWQGAASQTVAPAAGSVRLVVRIQAIGSVAARRTALDDARLTARGAAATVAGDPLAALSLLPTYRTQAEGGSGRQTLNGIPLDLPTGPASGVAPVGIPADLIDSLDPVQADDGSITPNYHLQNPTAAFAGGFKSGLSNFGGRLDKLVLADTRGRFGYALTAVGKADDGGLAGRAFTDSSGVRYDHASHAHELDGSLVLNYALSPSATASVVGLGTRRRGADISTTMPGALAFGNGPGNAASSDFGVAYALLTQTRGRDALHAVDVRVNGGARQDDANALAAGTPAGYVAGYRFSGSYDELGATRTFHDRSLSAKLIASRTIVEGYADQYVRRLATGQQAVVLAYEDHGRATSFGTTLKLMNGEGSFPGGAVEVTLRAARRIAGTDVSLTAFSAQAQALEASYAGSFLLSAPAGAEFVCGPNGTATVSGASALGARRPTARTLTGHLHRRIGRDIDVSAGGFLSDTSDALVRVVAPSLAPLTPAYLTSLRTAYAGLCGGQSLSGSEVYAHRYETVPHLIGREAFVDVKFPLGRLNLETTYEIYSRFVPALPADLAGTHTTLVAFSQLASVPLHRANAIVSYDRGGRLFALAAQYVSANNQANLPGHVTLSGGVRIPVPGGLLSASVQNLLGGYDGTFRSGRYAVPLAANGPAIPTLATPLARTWAMAYSMGVGPRPLKIQP